MAHCKKARRLIWSCAFGWAFTLAVAVSANCATQSAMVKLSLKASNTSPAPQEEITVTATLQPLIQGAQYFFNWGDNTSAAEGQQTNIATHSYSAAGNYVVTVRAQAVRGKSLASNAAAISNTVNINVNEPIAISLPAYRMQLTADRLTAKVGEQITYSVKVTREAPGLSFVFEWTQGSSSEQTSSQTETHAFERPGQYRTRVIAYKDGKRAATSNLVTVQVQEVASSLSLERLGGTLNTWQDDTFTAKLQPQPSAETSVEYCFVWRDGSGDECGNTSKRVHAFIDAGTYQVSVIAALSKGTRIFSQPLEVTVQNVAPSPPPSPPAHKSPNRNPKSTKVLAPLVFTVIVKAESVQQEEGKPIFVEAIVKPKPRPGSKVQFCFAWKDGPDAPCQIAPFGTHAYSAAGKYAVQAAAIVDGASTDLSPVIEVTVVSPGRSFLSTAAVILGTLAAAMGLHQARKFLRFKVTAAPDSGSYRIAKPTELQVGLCVQVRCVPQSAILCMNPPDNIVEKMREATHV